MAVYKVAQDVEADDKLLGPFSFRQFIYLIVVVIALALAWGLSQIFIGLAIIPLPVVVFFGALALPLRKDQPMEIYLAAIVSFYLKPRKRLWVPDGIESLVTITAPKVVEVQRAKDITETEAERRLSYLADIADTEGWAIRHAATPVPDSPMTSDAFYAAQATEDMLDQRGGISQSLDAMITQADERRRQEMVARMQQSEAPAVAPQSTPDPVVPPITDPYTALSNPQPNPMVDPVLASPQAADTSDDPHPQFNPYPTSIHQSVVQPLDVEDRLPEAAPPAAATEPEKPEANTSEISVSPDIISLANNTDLSIETIQREADRIKHKEEDDDEVFISLH